MVNPIGVPPLALGRYAALKAAATGGIERKVEVHRPLFRTIPRFGARFNPSLIARAVLPLARRLHAEAPFDLVDAQFFYPDGPAAARIAAELGLPLSIKARGADIHYWGTRADTRPQILAAGAQAAGLLAVCGALADDMAAIGLPREKIALHYTGLDRDRFRPLQHAQLRRRLARELAIGLPEGAPVLATVGALIPRKGQALVIEALAHLPADTRAAAGGARRRRGKAARARRDARSCRARAFPRQPRPRPDPAGALGRRCDGPPIRQRRPRQRLGRGARLRDPAGDHRCRRGTRSRHRARSRADRAARTRGDRRRGARFARGLPRTATMWRQWRHASAGRPTPRRWQDITKRCWSRPGSRHGRCARPCPCPSRPARSCRRVRPARSAAAQPCRSSCTCR